MSEPTALEDDALEPDPNEVENAWATEIERRRKEIREGKVQPIKGDVFLRELRRWEARSPGGPNSV